MGAGVAVGEGDTGSLHGLGGDGWGGWLGGVVGVMVGVSWVGG